jgi:hypothetical protein
MCRDMRELVCYMLSADTTGAAAANAKKKMMIQRTNHHSTRFAVCARAATMGSDLGPCACCPCACGSGGGGDHSAASCTKGAANCADARRHRRTRGRPRAPAGAERPRSPRTQRVAPRQRETAGGSYLPAGGQLWLRWRWRRRRRRWRCVWCRCTCIAPPWQRTPKPRHVRAAAQPGWWWQRDVRSSTGGRGREDFRSDERRGPHSQGSGFESATNASTEHAWKRRRRAAAVTVAARSPQEPRDGQ